MCVASEYLSMHSVRTSSVEFQELEMLWETDFRGVLQHLTCNYLSTNHYVKSQTVHKARWFLTSVYWRKFKL